MAALPGSVQLASDPVCRIVVPAGSRPSSACVPLPVGRPVDPEVVGRPRLVVERHDRERRRLDGVHRGRHVDAVAGRVVVQLAPEGVGPQSGHQRRRATQPGQPDRDVQRAAAAVRDEGLASSRADEVDEGFSDDAQHGPDVIVPGVAGVMLVDAAGLYFRAFLDGVPESVTAPDGRPVNAVRGFLDMSATLIARRRPSGYVACLDLDWWLAFRVALLPSYKAHRVAPAGGESIPDRLIPDILILLDVLAALGLATAGAEGFEADDVIATLAARPGRYEIVTGDRDLMIDEPHRSHLSRYSQLTDDVRDDITRFEPFFATAVRVLDLDRKRNAAMAQISALSPREREDAVARMQENSLIVQWVQQCLERRVSSYRWALERLVLQAPDNMAADADRLIGELAATDRQPAGGGAARGRRCRERAWLASWEPRGRASKA